MTSPRQLFDLALQIHTPKEQIVLTACACARTALQYIPPGEDRPRLCLEITERWCRGEATLGEVRQARDNVWEYYSAVFAASGVAAVAVVAAVFAASGAANDVDLAADDDDDAAAAATADADARAHAKHLYSSKEYDQAYQQAEQEMCKIILQYIPRLKNLLVTI